MSAEAADRPGNRRTRHDSREPVGSVQSRISNILALSLMTVLGLGALFGITRATPRARIAREASVQRAASSHAAGDTVLPSLGRIDPPAPPPQISPVMEGGAASEPGVDRVSLAQTRCLRFPSPATAPRGVGTADTGAACTATATRRRGVSDAAVPSAGPPMEASAQPGPRRLRRPTRVAFG